MSEKLIISKLSDEMKKRIKEIVKFHHGFKPKDKDIKWIDEMLKNNYSVLHDQRIIRNLVTVEVDKILLKHRDKIGSIKFERILLDKLIFRYLTFASMSYRAGIPLASILLCRTALEIGLRERIAEKLAEKEDENNQSKKIWELIKQKREDSLNPLIDIAENEGIITKQKIESIFQNLKLGNQNSRKILDKIIHGDIDWMVNFVKEKSEDSKVIGAKNVLDENKIIADSKIDEVAVEVLIGVTKIAEILYLGGER